MNQNSGPPNRVQPGSDVPELPRGAAASAWSPEALVTASVRPFEEAVDPRGSPRLPGVVLTLRQWEGLRMDGEDGDSLPGGRGP